MEGVINKVCFPKDIIGRVLDRDRCNLNKKGKLSLSIYKRAARHALHPKYMSCLTEVASYALQRKIHPPLLPMSPIPMVLISSMFFQLSLIYLYDYHIFDGKQVDIDNMPEKSEMVELFGLR